MPGARTAPLGLLLLVLTLAACGSSGNTSDGTDLEIDGVATTGTGLVPPDPTDPNPTIPDPVDATQIDISGVRELRRALDRHRRLRVDRDPARAELGARAGLFDELEESDGRVCAEIYGGPQHATVKGSVVGDRSTSR